MALKIIEDQYIMTSKDYIANAPSDYTNNRDNLVDMDPIDPGIETPKECPMCVGKKCKCGPGCKCKLCKDHKDGLHQINQSKIESLNTIINTIFEGIDNVIKDVEDSYHEITSYKDGAYRFIQRYKIKFQPGDIVYIIKQSIPKKDIINHKKLFDKSLLPGLKRQAELVDSGPEWYQFRPTKASKLKKSLRKFIGSTTGQAASSILQSVFGIGGLGIIGGDIKDLYKRMKDATR